MGSFIVNTKKEQEEMLRAIGKSFEDLFASVPREVRLQALHLPQGMSEMEAIRHMSALAEENRVYREIFRGAGAYHHYIPAVVKRITGREEFLTAYTPYQAELSQGILQSIFEYQTMIAELTGMDCANASVYDGATAAAEATQMCIERGRGVIFVSATTHPSVQSVIRTYAFGADTEVRVIPEKDGTTDLQALREALGQDSACLYVQQPNFYGVIEDLHAVEEIVHGAGARLIVGCNPVSLALLETPGEAGADIAVGEGQPLGLPLSFGGPYLGFMATTQKMMRKLPGRIVGQTKDAEGRTAYVLTLQAREQHIRREKAGSNICSNEALCALTAAVYLATMGAQGLQGVASRCVSGARFLEEALTKAGLRSCHAGAHFHEFVTTSDIPAKRILAALADKGILGGYPLDEHRILWCVTEMNTKKAMEETAAIVKEVCA